MEEKDFLSQFSNNNKPDSFKEEERIPVVKEKKPVNKVLLIVLIAVLLVALIAVYFLFLRPNIEVENFVDKPKTDVTAWVKQQGIEPSGILFKEEYNFDYDDGHIISQSIQAGKKVKKDAKLTFVVSLGADPDESIRVPDLKAMDKTEIERWIKDNKLLKTKITTSYSSVVPEDEVIDYSFTGCDEDSFTRGSTLKIQISKGEQPSKSVTVEDFIGKEFSSAETWAKNNGITLKREEIYSDTIAVGKIADQSVSGGSQIKTTETLVISVSKGKGTKMPNLSSMTREAVDDFLKENGIPTKYKYSTNTNYVLSQTPAAGSIISTDTKAEVVLNKGSYYYASDIGISNIVGMRATALEDILNNIRSSGIDAYCGSWSNPDGVYSYEHSKGEIVSVKVMNSKDEPYNLNDRLPLDTRFDIVVSKGLIYVVDGLDTCLNESGTAFDTILLSDKLSGKSISFSVDTTKEDCELYVNGTKVDASTLSIEIIEGQNVELKAIN